MSRKSMLVILAVFVVFSLMVAGCKKSATPPLEGEGIQAEDESAAMMKEAQSNPTVGATEVLITAEATTSPLAEVPPTPTEIVPVVTEAVPPVTTEVITPTVVVEATVAATAEPVTLSTPGKHVVQVGENLFRIALRYGTTVEEIAKANGITNAALIYVGQVLTIPGGTPGEPPSPTVVPPSGGETIHIVQPGENLFRIALKYNYSQYYLAKYNGIANPSLIYVGQVIRIP
ncbi:MAG TPA: LysM peptidoglycan-binding domain-containing protein [Anaerolineae bacterium]|nr:LysM peptidoglycan-binding domain-containing protein [Anaerolineae bacterium]HQH37217.1 LysM peptidoglycan-binding domain-containing protein [Anaerolineae bacterium]